MPRSRSSTQKHSRSSSKDYFKYTIGDILHSKYKITSLLGEGTFGRVLEAEDESGSRFALKLLKLTDKFSEAGKFEAEVLEKLNRADSQNSSNIVRMFEHFQIGDFYCLVFEKLGKSLFQVIESNNYKGRMHLGFKMRQVQDFARQILNALDFMHRMGLTHTDLKPENILLKHDEMAWDEERVRAISPFITLLALKLGLLILEGLHSKPITTAKPSTHGSTELQK
jgi:dual-specificity kinase